MAGVAGLLRAILPSTPSGPASSPLSKFAPGEFVKPVQVQLLPLPDIMPLKTALYIILNSTKKWLGWQDLNLRMRGSKPRALPLGDTPIIGFRYFYYVPVVVSDATAKYSSLLQQRPANVQVTVHIPA